MQKRKTAIELRGALWMTVAGKNIGGPGRVELLTSIAEHGSITQAAKAMKMSYKAAWDAIDQMSNIAGEALVERMVGGKGGGSTHLTKRGEQLVTSFKLIDQEHRRFVDELSKQAHGLDKDYLLIRKMNMKTSARNQFLGKVASIKRGAVNDEIDLEIAGGQQLAAIITHESSDNLGLKVGAEAFALIKASSIIIMTDQVKARFSARNRLSGTISRLHPGAVNTEVVIELPGGGTIASMITNESAHNLELATGMKASAIFKASSVIIGVPA